MDELLENTLEELRQSRLDLENNNRRLIEARQRMARQIWHQVETLADSENTIEQRERALARTRREHNRRKQMLENNTTVDPRPTGQLIPERVKWIENWIKTAVTIFPVKDYADQYKNLSEWDKIQMNDSMMKFMNEEWREQIYAENEWVVKDETEKYTESNMLAALTACEIDYRAMIPWFVDCYGLDISLEANPVEEED